MNRYLKLVALFAIVCSRLFAQQVASAPIARNGAGVPWPQLVTICSTNPGGGTCSSLVTTYTTSSLATACTGSLVALNSPTASGCSNPGYADNDGNVIAYAAAAGSYWCQFSGNGIIPFSRPCPSTGSSSSGTISGSIAATQVAFGSGTNAIQGNAGFTFTPTVTGLVATTTSTGTTTNQGAAFTGNFSGAGTDAQQVGAFGVGQNTGAGTVSLLIGLEGLIHNTSTGTVTEADALLAATNGLETGPIGLFTGLHVQDHTVTGATNSFGILLENGTRAIGFNGAASGQNLNVTTNNINLGRAPTGGSFNLFIGTGTTQNVTTTTGTNNICINASNLECFYSLTSGSNNIAIGQSAEFSVTTGTQNIALGNDNAAVTTGTANTALGYGVNNAANTSNVTAVGWEALQNNQTTEASAFGNQSQQANTTGLNSSFGSLSLLHNTTGTNNDVFGEDTLRDNVAGNRNVAMGARTLQSNNGGNDNTGLGYLAGYTATTANANVTGNFNTWVGSGTGPGSATQFSNQTVLGALALATCNNCVVLGRSTAIVAGGDTTFATRYSVDSSTTLVTTDFTLSGGWGSTASKAITVTTSKDSAFVMTVTSSGTGQGANPTIALTFHDGTWTNTPVCTFIQTGGTGIFGDSTVTARSATAYTWQWNATPSAAATYEFTGICLGT